MFRPKDRSTLKIFNRKLPLKEKNDHDLAFEINKKKTSFLSFN